MGIASAASPELDSPASLLHFSKLSTTVFTMNTSLAQSNNLLPQRLLGNSDISVSVVGLGCNNLGRKGTTTQEIPGATEVVQKALDSGINYFDVADCYGERAGLAEEVLGKALLNRREEAIIGSKFGMNVGDANGFFTESRGSAAYIKASIDATLSRLGTDYLDVYFLHTPDASTPIAETLETLDSLVTEGKIRSFGSSNFAGWQIAEAHYQAKLLGTRGFVVSESNYNLLDRRAELEVLPASDALGISVFPYFPLANGLLTGKYSENGGPAGSRLVESKPKLLADAPWQAIDGLASLAAENNITLLQLAFSWLASRPAVASVIAGATKVEQITANSQAVVELSAETLAAIDEIVPPLPKIALF